MAGFEMEMPGSFDTGGAFLSEPGTYHLAVMDVNEQPTSRDGKLLDGFRVEAEVLGGPQAKKQVELMFFNPKLTDKNNGEMAKKKQGRFVLATGVIQAAKPGEKVTVDLQLAKGRQFIATLALDDRGDDNAKKFLQLHFADIWHVDDPTAAKCEFNQAAIKLIPANLRRSPESFAKPDAKSKAGGSAGGNGSANGNGSASGGQGQQQPVAAGAVDLNDL